MGNDWTGSEKQQPAIYQGIDTMKLYCVELPMINAIVRSDSERRQYSRIA